MAPILRKRGSDSRFIVFSFESIFKEAGEPSSVHLWGIGQEPYQKFIRVLNYSFGLTLGFLEFLL